MKVLVVGVGGLGCPAALALGSHAALLTLADFDSVEVSNLHRQPFHHPGDVGRFKVDSAADKLRAIFPSLKVVGLKVRVTFENVDALFELHDLVIDGTDDAATKFLLNDAAVRAKKPLIYGGVLRMAGQAMRIEPGGPCLRCLFEGPPPEPQSCAQAGVLGSMAGVIGGLQASLALRPGETRLHLFDGQTFESRAVQVKRSPDCLACGTP